jgi:hypothetical protein
VSNLLEIAAELVGIVTPLKRDWTSLDVAARLPCRTIVKTFAKALMPCALVSLVVS